MSTTAKITTIGFYNYDGSLFDNMIMPEAVDRETLINTILLNCGEMPVLYSNFNFMKNAIGLWSKKWYKSINRIANAIDAEYNPIHNFDRNEEYADKEHVDSTGSRKNDETAKGTTSSTLNSTDTMTRTKTENSEGDTVNTVAAYNSSTYQPDEKSEIRSGGETEESGNSKVSQTGGTTNSGTTSITGTTADKTDRTFSHSAHLFGNIGVTKSQEMVQDEIDLRSNNNIYDIISELYKSELCLYTY